MVDEKTNGQAVPGAPTAPDAARIDVAELRARAATYAFLSRALSDEELPAEFLGALAADGPETGTALDGYMVGLAGLDAAGLEAAHRDLAADHAALLLGMSARPVSPFESVYTSPEQLMRQEAWERAVRDYAASGFKPVSTLRVPEDHISIELQFCSALLNRAADFAAAGVLDAAARDAAAQASFVRGHLAAWVPRFCDLLEERAHTDFYRGVAQMLRELLTQEAAE